MKNNNIFDQQQSPSKSTDSVSPMVCTSNQTRPSLSISTECKSPYHNVARNSRGETTNNITRKRSEKYKTKKPKDMPKRPLSAYNIFFKQERQKILASILVDNCDGNKPGSTASIVDSSLPVSKRCVGTEDVDTKCGPNNKYKNQNSHLPHGKISFENLAKVIAKRWKNLDEDELNKLKILADEDLYRYKQQMDEYHDNEAKKKTEAEELVARQRVQLEVRRIQNAQNLEHNLQVTRLQFALKQLQQEHQNVLRQLHNASSSHIDQSVVMNNGVNLNTSEATLSPILSNILMPQSSLGISFVSPFCNLAVSNNMNLFEQPQSATNISTHSDQVTLTSRSSQSELRHGLVDIEENDDYLTSLVNILDKLKR